MAVKKEKNAGIARIYRANAQSLILFGAIHQSRSTYKDHHLTDIVKVVVAQFGIKEDPEVVLRDYYRVLQSYLDNGGI